MTEEIQELVEIKQNVVSREVSVTVYTLELLIDVASNLLQDTDLRDRVIPGLQVVLNEEKAKNS
jgi:hypothetical protein